MIEERKHTRTELTLTQLVATALASVTAAFVGSLMGTAGTVIGAGLASVITMFAATLYQRSLDRTRSVVRRVGTLRTARGTTVATGDREPKPGPVPTAGSGRAADSEAETVFHSPVGTLADPENTDGALESPPATRRRGPNRVLVSVLSAAAFLLGIGAVTGVELLHGGPLSGGNTGTSVGSIFGQPTQRTTPAGRPGTSGTAPSSTSSAPAPTGGPSATSVPQAPPAGASSAPASAPSTSTTPPTTTTAPTATSHSPTAAPTPTSANGTG